MRWPARPSAAPSMPEPKDFYELLETRDKASQNTDEHPGDDCRIRIRPKYFDIQADCQAGNFSACLTEQGADVAAVAGRPYWAKRTGCASSTLTCTGCRTVGRTPITANWKTANCITIFLFGRDDRNTMFFHEMIMRLLRAIDVITVQPQWDGENLIVQGCSQGGAQAIIAGALDPRVDLVCSEIPGMCDHTGMLVGRVSCWPKLVTNTPNGKPDPKRLEAARYYDLVKLRSSRKGSHVRDGRHDRFGVSADDGLCDVQPTAVRQAYSAVASGTRSIRRGREQFAQGDAGIPPQEARIRMRSL